MFLKDNCIQEFNFPNDKINVFDYSSELNLIASFEYNTGTCFVWNPQDGKIVQEIELASECHCHVVFLPKGRYLAVTIHEPNHDSGVYIYSIDSGEEVMNLSDDSAGWGDMDVMARTPDNRLLVGGLLVDYLLDLDNKTVVEKRKIGHKDLFYFMVSMCSSKVKNTICFTQMDDDQEGRKDGFCVLTFDTSTDGTMTTTFNEITYCMIEGDRSDLGVITGLAYDEDDHVIVATLREIIIMETACEGSPAHVIVSSGLPCDIVPYGYICVNHKNQLMVSNGECTIKVYQYQTWVSLQHLCRRVINYHLRANQVEHLPLPITVKNYLLYKK